MWVVGEVLENPPGLHARQIERDRERQREREREREREKKRERQRERERETERERDRERERENTTSWSSICGTSIQCAKLSSSQAHVT